MFVFNAKIEETEKLERMLIGRKKTADWLEKQVLQYMNMGVPTQALIIGPRGAGKTHLLKILYSRIITDPDVQEKLAIAYMSEDEYGIDTYLDLLVRIFKAFIRQEKNDIKKQALKGYIEELKSTQPEYRIPTAERLLLDYLNDQNLLVLIENLNNIFKGIGEKGQSKWRDFIMKHGNINIIATSQSIFSDVNKRDRPFFNFFNITYLKKLTFEDARLLLLELAEMENQEGLIEHLNTDKGKGNLRAIYELTEGNHRLLVTFYDFLKAEYKSELSKAFLHTLDKLKPYYESFLKLLSPQQQKIIQYLALERIPKNGVEIAANCFLKSTTISKQMSELQRLGYVDARKEGRSAYYEITEPLLRMCIEVNESNDGIVKLFVDFLGNLYTAKELKECYLKYAYLKNLVDPNLKNTYKSEEKLFQFALLSYVGNWQLPKSQEDELLLLNTLEEREEYLKKISNSEGLEYLEKYINSVGIVKTKEFWHQQVLNDRSPFLSGYGFILIRIIFNRKETLLNQFLTDEQILNSLSEHIKLSAEDFLEKLTSMFTALVKLMPDQESILKFRLFYSTLKKLYPKNKKFNYFFKIFDIAHQYLIEDKKEVLFLLSKEERQAFKEMFLENKEEVTI